MPDGLFTLSLYWFNKDGHKRNNRFRDYRLSIRAHPAGRPMRDIDGFERRPEVARGRVQDFWNGVYKRFLVRGPCELTIHQDRNHSFNTNLSGIFLDLVDEYPVPYFRTVEEHEAERAERETARAAILREIRTPGARARRFAPAASEPEAARRLFGELETMRLWNPVWQATDGREHYARLLKWLLRAIERTDPGPARRPLYQMATTCYWRLGLYEKWEAGQTLLGRTTARQIEKALRWDGVHDFEGKGYQVVTDYLREHPADGQAERVADAVPRQENRQETGLGKAEP